MVMNANSENGPKWLLTPDLNVPPHSSVQVVTGEESIGRCVKTAFFFLNSAKCITQLEDAFF